MLPFAQSLRNLLEISSVFNGLNQLTYVVHSLVHICDDIEEHSGVQNAYKYENNAGKIVKSVRHAKNVSQQIYNRAFEHLNTLTIPENNVSVQLKNRLSIKNKVVYERIILKDLRFDKTDRNKWFLTQKKRNLFI